MPPDTEPRTSLAAARTYGEAVKYAAEWLRRARAGDTPELDAAVLLSHVTGRPRATLMAFPERLMTPEQAREYAELVAGRVAHAPVAYLTGHREFMGLDLLVDPRVLIPRPETELLVEAALSHLRTRLAAESPVLPVVADIGTGSGAIAIAVANYEPRLPYIYAADISMSALALAEENAGRLGVSGRIRFLESDLLSALPEPIDVLLANLPYVAPEERPTLPLDVSGYEPDLALYSEDHGLHHIRRLLQQAPAHLRSKATLLLEIGYDQHGTVQSLAEEAFPGCKVTTGKDYAGWDRYLLIQTSEQ